MSPWKEDAEGSLSPFERALAGGHKVLIARGGKLIEVSPDRSERVIRDLPPPRPIGKGTRMSLRKPVMKNTGLHPYRFQDNPEEKRFAEAWDKANVQGRTLEYLLTSVPNVPTGCTPREVTVAATVMQWLGSSVGQCFLRDMGYVKKEEP